MKVLGYTPAVRHPRKIGKIVFLLLVAGVIYVGVGSHKDRERRIVFVTVMTEFRKIVLSLESELLASGKMTPRRETREVEYLDAMDASENIQYTMDIRSNTVTVEFSQAAGLRPGETIILEPVISGGQVRWLCNKGSVDVRYRSSSCRSDEGFVVGPMRKSEK